ncbi:MAG: hypothetical protein P8M50_01840 [Paracoccaceae bacterium]|nr:hypothetical protein [Paracoccaceae bacterium]
MGFDWKFFDRSSWAIINEDQLMLDWVANAKKIAKQKFNSNDLDEKQFRCGGTWFVGQNFLKNNLSGKLNNIAFDGLAVNSILERYGKYYKGWDEAQLSICFEGYPRLSDSETSKSFAYRKNNFGAHVDGILPIGESKRRYAQEWHAFIFGIPLVNFNEFAAPVVV